MFLSIAAISAGAALGAILRWLLGLLLNAVYPAMPLGTLAANLLGGLGIGLALGLFASHPEIGPHWRLMVITGFLGALTTFSTFSAEVAFLLQQQRLFLAMGTIGLHVCGSLLMTFIGLGGAQLLRRLPPAG